MATNDPRAPSIAIPLPQTGATVRLRAWVAQVLARAEALADRERDQFPLWLPVGLGTGIAAWFALSGASAWTAFLLAAGAVLLAGAGFGGGMRWGRGIAVFAAMAILGCTLIWWRAQSVAAPRLERPRMTEFTARIETVQRLPAREAVRLVVVPADPGLPRARVNVAEDKAVAGLEPGAVVRLRAYLMPPPPMAVPGAYDFARTAWFQGVGATGRAIGDVMVIKPAKDQGWRARIAGWRQRLGLHIQSRLEGGEGGIATALATGDQNAIPEEDAEAMRRSGLAHLLSVSGLHLTAVVGAVMLATLKLLALSPALALRFRLVLIAAGVGAAAGVAYTLLTGADVPTVRACIASLLVLAGIAIGRDAITLRLVATGALIVLLLWPYSLAGPSFQMSFAAMTAIVALHEHPRIRALLSRRDEGFARKVGRFVLGLVITGLAVEAALTPIALYHFHKAGFYGAFANLVAIPLTTFVIMPLEALALLLDLVGLGDAAWWLTGKALAALLGLAHAVADAPGSVAMLPSMPVAAFGLMIVGGLWFCLWKTRLRWGGAAPFLVGALWALATPTPDILVTGDGRHVAVRGADGTTAILRDRAGDYVRDMLGEASGSEAEMPALSMRPSTACSRDLCVTDIMRGGRRWRLLTTRSRDFVRWREMVRACADADIVIADRRLPRGCTPRWLKADRALLTQTGGLAITLSEKAAVATVADRVGRHPWRSGIGTATGR